MRPWLAAARPKTLVAGLVPVVVGSAAAYRFGSASISVFFSALFGALFIQIGTNYVNDASDFLRGADTSSRIGPPRMAQLGLITPKQLYFGAALCFLLATAFGLYLIYSAGWPVLVIGVASILAAIAYTAGPMPLAYFGLGDLFVLIFFGFVAVAGTYFVHGNEVTAQIYIFGGAVGAHAMALIAVNNIRDIETDKAVGKRTIAVRIGEQNSKLYISALLYSPYLLVSWLAITERAPFLLAVFLSLPLALVASAKVFKARIPGDYLRLLPLVALVQLLFGIFLSAALWGAR
jgi:1,4-dihydroxy-2-naphthoate octaprenyltransferase